jgi:hypothetical protein
LKAACTTGAQAAFEVAQVDAVVADELARLGDAPLDQPVDDQALLLGREDGAGLGAVQRLDALVQEHHVLERRRQLELEAGLGDDFLDLTQRVDHGHLALVDDEQRGTASISARARHRRRSPMRFMVVPSAAFAVTRRAPSRDGCRRIGAGRRAIGCRALRRTAPAAAAGLPRPAAAAVQRQVQQVGPGTRLSTITLLTLE